MCRNKWIYLEDIIGKNGKNVDITITYVNLTLECTLACMPSHIHTNHSWTKIIFSPPENMYIQIHTCIWW